MSDWFLIITSDSVVGKLSDITKISRVLVSTLQTLFVTAAMYRKARTHPP